MRMIFLLVFTLLFNRFFQISCLFTRFKSLKNIWNQAEISLYTWAVAPLLCALCLFVHSSCAACFLNVLSPGLTCRRKTILLASCISFSSCSWWASSCSSQDFSSSCPSCPREGHNPHRDTSSERKWGTGEMRQGSFFCCCVAGILWIYSCSTRADVQPTNLWQISSLSAQICHPEVPRGPQTDRGLFLL